MTWFGLSDKWEVRKEIQNHLPKKSHMEMTPDERKSTLVKLSKIYPDPAAFYRCKHFRFKGVRPLTAGPSTGYQGSTQEAENERLTKNPALAKGIWRNERYLVKRALCAQALNSTTVLIKKAVRPENPPPGDPLIIKCISGNIRKCAGCSKPLSSEVQGFWVEDVRFCCGRYEAYYYWNKGCNSYQVASGTRHYHINPVCTKYFRSSNENILLGSGITPTHAISQIAGQRFEVRVKI